MRQILLNLVGNAIKFTEKGAVTVYVRCERPESASPRISFEVADTGVGLTKPQMAKLFAAFTQADSSTTRKFGGTGLGLSIAKHLATLLGGDISVESLVGRGSSFTLNVETGSLAGVPMLNDLREAGVALDAVPAPSSGQGAIKLTGRILLAEDGHDNQVLVATHLRRAGAQVQIAENGRIAVDLALAADRSGEPFDVILMDMQMPEMDGYTATATLRKDGYRGPIVALTAHAMEGDRAVCIAAGCDDYLTKPIDREKLLGTVARHGARARAAVESGDTILATTRVVQAPPDAPLVSELANDPDVADMVEGFVRVAGARADAILAALADGDTSTMRRLVHQLKGAAGGYGFPSITEQARVVETAFASGDPAKVAAEAQALSSLCYRAGRGATGSGTASSSARENAA